MAAKQYPFYIQSTVVLFGIILLLYSMSMLTDILVPLSFALLIAILLNPLSMRLQRLKVPRVMSIILSMLLGIVVIAGVFYFLSSQIIQFGESLPVIKQKFGELAVQLQMWVFKTFGIALHKQVQFLNEALSNSKSLVGKTLGGMLGTLSIIFLIPVYVFLIMFYKTLILNFLFEVFSEENSTQVADILKETKGAIQSYIVGLLIEMMIVAAMNSTALLILGVPYAILIGVIGAILNVLPYLGGLVAIALPILMATVSKDGFSTQLGVIAAYLIIQFIDNNILVPRIVSSKVQINALVSIVVVLLGGALWGLSGMFLSIPFIAVLKIIFDRITDLKPWGKLLGDSVPTRHKGQIWGVRRRVVSE